jgi:hypothetical protein
MSLDLHPDDLAARIALIDALSGLRRRSGWSLRRYATAIGATFSAVSQSEVDPNPNPSILTVERRGHILGRRLVVTLIDLPLIDGDPLVAILADRRPADPDARAETTAALLLTRLNLARADLGTTVEELAKDLGITASAIKHQHASGATIRLATVQRYARALGGRLAFELGRLEAR